MKICDTCGMKFIRNDYYEKHLATHKADDETPVVEVSDAEVRPEEVVEETKEVSVPEEVVLNTETDEIVLKFSKPVEIYINGIAYLGKEVKAPNMMIASEIVRIAREAYGREILI